MSQGNSLEIPKRHIGNPESCSGRATYGVLFRAVKLSERVRQRVKVLLEPHGRGGQKKLAAALGVSQSTMSEMLTGDQMIGLDYLPDLARFFGQPLEYFLADVTPPVIAADQNGHARDTQGALFTQASQDSTHDGSTVTPARPPATETELRDRLAAQVDTLRSNADALRQTVLDWVVADISRHYDRLKRRHGHQTGPAPRPKSPARGGRR